MTLTKFEAMIARAGYKLQKVYRDEHGEEFRRKYESVGKPALNVPIEDGGVSDWDAAKTEALLDEEGYFQDED